MLQSLNFEIPDIFGFLSVICVQVFMIEPLRSAIINANCADVVDLDELTDDRISTVVGFKSFVAKLCSALFQNFFIISII